MMSCPVSTYIRTQPLEVGKDFTLDANSGATTWPLSVHVLSKEPSAFPPGRFDCFHLEPILAGDGIFQASGQLEVWVTEAPPTSRSSSAPKSWSAPSTRR
jgi:hypothetical protein